MNKKANSRRKFLKNSVDLFSKGIGLGFSQSILSSCSVIDQYFGIDREDLGTDVVILGGGLAGLSAAFELKRNNIPFYLFEASDELGGKVKSLQTPEGIIELGSESFHESEEPMLRLLKELNIEFVPKEKRILLDPNEDLFKRYLAIKAKVLLKSRKLKSEIGSKNLKEAWNALISGKEQKQMESLWGYLNRETHFDHGTTWSDLTFQNWILTSERMDQSRNEYTVENGLGYIIQCLQQRLDGVVTDYRIKLGTRCIRISREGNGFQLELNSKNQFRKVKCNKLIVAIPFGRYQTLQGWRELSISENKINAIYSAEKLNLYKGAFSLNPESSLKIKQILKNQKWVDRIRSYERPDSNIVQIELFNVGEKILNNDNVDKDLTRVYQSLLNSSKWSLEKVWASQSGATCFAPHPSELKELWHSEYGGTLQFAGDFTSAKYWGRMAGAIESGVRAASLIKGV